MIASFINRYFPENTFARYLFKFGLYFCLLYLFILFLQALANPVGLYVPFFDHYLDIGQGFGYSLLFMSSLLLKAMALPAVIKESFVLKLQTGQSVSLAFQCMGFQVMCFWIAFILVNDGSWKRRLKWIIMGCAAIYLINVVRIAMVLVALKGGWGRTFRMENHDLFNFVAYGFVFFMIWLYDRDRKFLQNTFQNKQLNNSL